MISAAGTIRPLCFCAALVMTALGAAGAARQDASLRIVSPTTENIVSGSTRIQIVIEPEDEIGNVRAITYSVNGRLACTVEKPPFTCAFEPGDVVRSHHIRVVATMTDGRRLVDNVRTKDLGYAERIRT